MLEFPEHNIMDGWTSGVRFRTRDGGSRNSQTDAKTKIPSHLELWDLRAKVSRDYEDAKDGRNDASLLGEFYDQFSKRVSLRKGTEAHPSGCVGSIDFVP